MAEGDAYRVAAPSNDVEATVPVHQMNHVAS